jgi:sigma-B regulation protein RsbU (phosphoserine phosphatase)
MIVSSTEVRVIRKPHIIAAALLCAVLSASSAVGVFLAFKTALVSGNPAWLQTERSEVFRIEVIRPDSPAAGVLKRGDEIVAVDGKGMSAGFDSRQHLMGRPPGPYRVLIRRDGRLMRFLLRTVPFGVSFSSFFMLTFPLVGLLFLASGIAIFLMKRDDPRALLLSATFVLFSGGGNINYEVANASLWALTILVLGQAVSLFFWPAFLHFCLLFPQTAPRLAPAASLARWLYLPAVVLTPCYVVGGVYLMVDPAVGQGLLGIGAPLGKAFLALALAYPLLALLALAFNYTAANEAARRKVRVVVAGTILGFLPVVVLLAVTLKFDLAQLGLWPSRVLIVWMVLSLPLVPLSTGYAIVRHQVMGLRLILRQSARYLLVARGFLILEVLEVALVLVLMLAGPPAHLLEELPLPAAILATMAVTAAALGALVLLHRRVMPKIDRRFFREAYDSQRIVAEIGEAARNLASVDQLIGMAAARIEETLHPESLTLFLREAESGRYASVFPAEDAGHVSADAGTVEALERSRRIHETESGGLALPIVTKQDLLGILSLGPRRGDLAYSGDDRRLLEAVAWQLAFAIENSRLVRRRVEEERLRREIEMAGAVQRRLFPERPPQNRRLELAGVCHPAQGIGGDYYDFLSLGGHTIGIAVADVAGKGISAALIMSIVQASLRSQAGASGVKLPALVASMNELLYRSTARNAFATFFYAQFDAESRRLTYVNAGHNPPMLVRPAGFGGGNGHGERAEPWGSSAGAVAVAVEAPAAIERVRLLTTGGLVIGALKGSRYEAETLELAPGDVLVAYTDGVTEAFNAADEEFGEDRLREVVLASVHLSPAALADRIVEAVHAWVKDAPQHDDITLVVARVR